MSHTKSPQEIYEERWHDDAKVWIQRAIDQKKHAFEVPCDRDDCKVKAVMDLECGILVRWDIQWGEDERGDPEEDVSLVPHYTGMEDSYYVFYRGWINVKGEALREAMTTWMEEAEVVETEASEDTPKPPAPSADDLPDFQPIREAIGCKERDEHPDGCAFERRGLGMTCQTCGLHVFPTDEGYDLLVAYYDKVYALAGYV